MKKSNTLFLVSTFVVLCLATSCSNNNAELEKLRAENVLLKQQLGTENNSSINSPGLVFDSLSQAARSTALFRNKAAGDMLVIPASWRFDKSDFKTEINLADVVYFRFYPLISETILGDTLRLAMVPVDKNGNDLVGTEGDPRVYNFTMNCPDVCSQNNVLNTDAKSLPKLTSTTFIKQ